jgi:hypothetical protein
MDVRHVNLGIARRADRSDRLALRHTVFGSYSDRAEMEQRDRVIVRGPDRHRAPVARQPAGEGDATAGGRTYV